MFTIIIGENASTLELTACEDLKLDLEKVTRKKVKIIQLTNEILLEKESQFPKEGITIIVGCPETNGLIKDLSNDSSIPLTIDEPGKRGGIIHLFPNFNPDNSEKVVILAGSDPQGAQYMVYEFSSIELRIDPFEYWTDKKTRKIENFYVGMISPRVIKPPFVPILAYFDNDNDELANITKPYLEFSLEHWKEIIKSLIRLKYNAIDLHDHLGRSEFYRWPHYKKLRPDYEPNVDLLEAIIEYAHERGVMIQVSFYLCWHFKQVSDKAAGNWRKYKQDWIDVWTYYLEHTPIGKSDIFLNRPRDQLWDRKYKGKGKNNPVAVFNEVFPVMVKIIKKYNPDAIIVVDLYSEGRDAYNNGFRPAPKNDYIMVWPDDGFGAFEYMPEDLDDYKFGIYMHAGYFLNHVVQNPYSELLSEHMKPALLEHGMTHYCLVNGQTFRHYLQNMEACSKICEDPRKFDPEQYNRTWINRYFDEEVVEDIVKIFKYLHDVQPGSLGYISIMFRLKFMTIRLKILKYAKIIPRKVVNWIYEKIGKLGDTYTSIVGKNQVLLQDAMNLINKVKGKIQDENHFFHDFVELQVRLFYELNNIAYHLHMQAYEPKNKSHTKEAKKWILIHHETRLKGDRNPKWVNWYDPKIRRPNGGYFDIESLEKKGNIRVKNLR